MATTNTDERNLSSVSSGGQVHEDLMDRLYDISPEDRPFIDMISTGNSSNHYKEWVEEKLENADPRNEEIDGADTTGNDSRLGKRKGNYHQTMTKIVQVSDRARSVDAVGAADELIKQVSKRQRAARRDEEASMMSNYAANPGDGSATASRLAGVGSWIGCSVASDSADLDGYSQNRFAGATGTGPALSDSANGGGYPDTAPVSGTARALTETLLKDAIRATYENGGNIKYAIGRPAVIEIMSDYMFSSSARVATMQTNVSQGNRQGSADGNGSTGGGVTAQAAVNMYIGSFGSVIFCPDRFQPNSIDGVGNQIADVSDLFLIDPDLWEASYLQGYRTKPLGDTGLSSKRLISVDVTLCCMADAGNACIADIDETASMTS